jgi:hypothetical protein
VVDIDPPRRRIEFVGGMRRRPWGYSGRPKTGKQRPP